MSEELNKEVKSNPSKRRFRNPLKGVVSGELLSNVGVAKNLPFLLFVTLLLVLYIGYGYYVDNTVRKISREEKRGDELYSELQSLMELYDQESLRSKVANEVSSEGLFETKDPPRVVDVDKEFYRDNAE